MCNLHFCHFSIKSINYPECLNYQNYNQRTYFRDGSLASVAIPEQSTFGLHLFNPVTGFRMTVIACFSTRRFLLRSLPTT